MTLLDRIECLQSLYEDLVAKRGKVIKVYDSIWDGDPAKSRILARMDYLGMQIRAVEKRMGILVDQLLEEEAGRK